MGRIFSLPPEILTEILTPLTKPDLQHLSLTCTFFRAIVQSLLLSRVKITVPNNGTDIDLKNIESCLQLLAQAPHPASYIWHLTIIRGPYNDRPLHGLSALLDATVQLRSLYLNHVCVDDDLAVSLIDHTRRPGFSLKFSGCIFATTLTLTSTPIQLETILLDVCLGSPAFPLTLFENGRETIRAFTFKRGIPRPLTRQLYEEFRFPAEHLVLPCLRSLATTDIPIAFFANNPSIEQLWMKPCFHFSRHPSRFEGLPLSILPNLRAYRGSLKHAKAFVPGRAIERVLLDDGRIFNGQDPERWWQEVLDVISKTTGPLLGFACVASFTITAFKQIVRLCPSLRILYVHLARKNNIEPIDPLMGVDMLLEQLSNFKQLYSLNIDQGDEYFSATVEEFMRYLTVVSQKAPTITIVKWRTDPKSYIKRVYCGRWEGKSKCNPDGWLVWSEVHEDEDDWFPKTFWSF